LARASGAAVGCGAPAYTTPGKRSEDELPFSCTKSSLSSTNVILLRTPGTATGLPLISLGLYLNFDAASSAAASKIGELDSTTNGSATEPFSSIVNSTITYPSRRSAAASVG